MKKKITVLILLVLFIKYNAQTFVKESKEIDVLQKYKWINYLGTINNNAYYYDYKINKPVETTFLFHRINQTDLNPETPTEIKLDLSKRIRTYTLNKVYLKNKHIYIIYSVVDTKAEPPGVTTFLKVLDENFTEINTVKINNDVVDGVKYLGDCDIIFSQDEKKALLVLNHISEKNIDRRYIYAQKKTEVIWFNAEKNTIESSLFFGKNNKEFKTFYENFSIANNGNIAFTIAEYKSNLQEGLMSAIIGLVRY
ncbi:MAG: hypothetical protein HY062_02505, partial [Bacteroidetes bacterium]|nr:hypothetical protein [Bacteroidota bacterium]